MHYRSLMLRRRFLVFVLLCALLASGVHAAADPQAEAYEKIIALQESYPEGMPWTNAISYSIQLEYQSSVGRPGYYMTYTGYGCVAFALILSDAAFAGQPLEENPNVVYEALRVGDILRINNDTHSVVILEIYDDHVVIAEGNYNSSIHWGRTLTKEQVLAADYYISRYPESADTAQQQQQQPSSVQDTTGDAVVLSPQKLMVDGSYQDVEKYNINGRNYFKLRDLASLLNGTPAQCSVDWDAAAGQIRVQTGESYSPVGGELVFDGVSKAASAVRSPQSLLINGALRSDLSVYNIGGNNYFQLRELGEALGFTVDYDADTDTALVFSGAAAPGSAQPAVPPGPPIRIP